MAKEIKDAEVVIIKEGEEIYAPEKIEDRAREGIKKGSVVTKLALRAKIPWDKLSDIVGGVIRPLKDKGLPPEITIEVRAQSEEGFDKTTLETHVKETLNQIGASIEYWNEE